MWWRIRKGRSVLPCASRMCMRLVCHIWVSRSFMICWMPGRMCTVNVCIPHGWIWMKWCARSRFHCLRWNHRIRLKILIFWALRSSTKCAIPIFCRFWICPEFRCWRLTAARMIRLWSVVALVRIIRNRWQIFLIFSISEKERRSMMHWWMLIKPIRRQGAAGNSSLKWQLQFRVCMYRLFMMWLTMKTVPLHPLDLIVHVRLQLSTNRLWQI